MLPNRNWDCGRGTKILALKCAFPESHTTGLTSQAGLFPLSSPRYVVPNIFRELKLSCLFVSPWRIVEAVMRILKIKWKCRPVVYHWGRRPLRLWSPLLCHSGECCTIHLLFPAGSARNCLCICADRGKGHISKQQRWPGGRLLRRWRAHLLYEKKITTAEIVWAFLQAQSFCPLCHFCHRFS